MELEVYVNYLQKQNPSKFSKDTLEKMKDLLHQNLELQKSTGDFRIQVKSYNNRIAKCAIQKLAILSKEYAENGQQEIADALMIKGDSRAFRYKPYMMYKIQKTIRPFHSYSERDQIIEMHEQAKQQLVSIVSELNTKPLFCKGDAEYRVSLQCIKRFNYVTRKHDILDYWFCFVKELRESFSVGVTYRDNVFQKALEDMNGEDFITWYEQETLKEREKFVELKSEYETIMASEPDNR